MRATTITPERGELATGGAAALPPGLWRSSGLRRLFTASTLARLANEAARVAVVLLVLERTGSPALAGAVVGALTLPALVTGPVLGAWLDRTTRRRRAFVANQVLLLGGLLGLLAATGSAPAAVVLGLALLSGVTAPVLTGGFTGLIAPLVPAPLLRRAYGAEATSYNVAAVTGPALVGTLAGLLGAGVAVAVTAGLSAIALAAVLRVPMPVPALPAGSRGLWRTVRDGLELLVRTPALRSVTTATTVAFAGMGAMPVAFPLLARELGAGAAAAGLLFSTFALGALAGSLLVAVRTPRTGPMRLTYLGITGLGLAWAALVFAPSLPVAVAVIAVAGGLEGPVLASTLAVRELWSPASMRTQVVTTAASLKFGGFAVGSAVAGAAAAAHGVTGALAVAATAQALAVVSGLLVGGPSLRRARRA
ncbi:MAG TPA: MFS transporter [Mycobacteriales bacterium]|nr:MFS transporter [Mycobacteriales bacterium]